MNIPPRHLTQILLIVLLLFVGLIYSNTLHSPPVLDDRTAFIDNPAVYIDGLSLDALARIHSGRFGRTRFIPMLSFAVDHLFGQGSIVRFHLTNILIHLIATTAVFLLAMGLAGTAIGRQHLTFLAPASFGLSVAVLWSLQPVQTNAVTYLVQRMTSFAALFYFTALAGYVWARTGQSGLLRMSGWLVFILAMLCAFLSKENSATLPLAVLLVEKIFIVPTLGERVLGRIKWPHWLVLAIILLLVFPFAAAKLSHLASQYVEHGRHFTLGERLFTELRVVVFYISLLALPLPGRLNLDHDFPVSHSFFSPPATFLSLLLLGFLIFIAFRVRRRHPFIAFGIFFFFLNLLIESSVIPLELVFEHRLYLPSLGFCLVLAALMDWSAQWIPAANQRERKTILLLGVVIIGCLLATSTSLRNHAWRDKLTIHQDIARKSPLKPRAHASLGMQLAKNGRYGEALISLQQAIALGKDHSEEYINAASNIVSIFVAQKKYGQAIEWGGKLLKNRPEGEMNYDDLPILMANIALSYWKLGEYEYSLEAFKNGLTVGHPQHTPFLINQMERMLREASSDKEGRNQLNLDGSEESIYSRMAMTLLANRDYAKARIFLAKARAINPDHSETLSLQEKLDMETTRNRQARIMIGRIRHADSQRGLRFRFYLSLADFIKENYTLFDYMIPLLLEKAVQLEPSSTGAAHQLAGWHLQNGNVEAALRLAEKHLDKQPEFTPLLELAAKGYLLQGENRKAAAKLYELITLYPGHPDRLRYAKLIATYYESERNSIQKSPAGIE